MDKITEQIIKYDDIRVGDRIRVEWMMGGILYSQTGTVAKINIDGDPEAQSGWIIGTACIKESIKNGEKITITLLDRPTPKLSTEVGSVIHVSECRGAKCDTLAILGYDIWWYTPVPVAGRSFHDPSDITEWEPREFVEVQE